jgi:RsiW-degrading membrane proteinase PrsW (M82 family)
VSWVVALVPLLGIVWHVAGMPGTVLVGVQCAVLVHAGILLWIAHAAHVRIRPPAATFALAWGAGVAAPAAALANDLVQARIGAIGSSFGVTGVPALEEAAKAAVLFAVIALWPGELRGLRAGLVLGGLVGLGFAAAENVEYFLVARVQDGAQGLVRAIAIRGLLEGAVHPVFTATTGAALGFARVATGRRALPGIAGFAAAVAQHAVWNGVASPSVSGILCNGVGPGGACRGDPDMYRLLVVVPAVVGAALAPGIVTLAALARGVRPNPP